MKTIPKWNSYSCGRDLNAPTYDAGVGKDGQWWTDATDESRCVGNDINPGRTVKAQPGGLITSTFTTPAWTVNPVMPPKPPVAKPPSPAPTMHSPYPPPQPPSPPPTPIVPGQCKYPTANPGTCADEQCCPGPVPGPSCPCPGRALPVGGCGYSPTSPQCT
mmetsp:Transcript_41287/g.95664  ORF Transcript_41287/g.95664 Transcript_41287/m.95664 type:complete len:161 (+) Transcript_41287:173-655(+)